MNSKSQKTIISIFFISVTTFVVSLCYPNAKLLFDSADYWRRGEFLWKNGFSLYNLPDAFRGYLFPLYVGTAGKLGGVQDLT